MGIKEIKEVLTLMSSVIKAVDAATKNGLSWDDFYHFVPVVPKVFPALEGIENVDDELFDLTEEELDELKVFVKDELDIPDNQVEMFIEKGLSIALDTAFLIKEIYKSEE